MFVNDQHLCDNSQNSDIANLENMHSVGWTAYSNPDLIPFCRVEKYRDKVMFRSRTAIFIGILCFPWKARCGCRLWLVARFLMLPLRFHLLWIYYDKRDLIIAKRCAILFCVTLRCCLDRTGLDGAWSKNNSFNDRILLAPRVFSSLYSCPHTTLLPAAGSLSDLAAAQQAEKREVNKGMTESDSQNLRQFRQAW